MTPRSRLAFQRKVWSFYKTQKRSFPWRETSNPYFIYVSEIMLQQTQTQRVLPKYLEFIKRFPTIQKLARAQRASVLKAWSGLGYNRRAMSLHKAAKIIVAEFSGRIPSDTAALESLPGVGKYTAQAIRTFAFHQSSVFIETNIRTVFLFSFFKNSKRKISDREVLEKIEASLPASRIKEWYEALMDYGAWIKRGGSKVNQKSSSYKKQSPFIGSHRQKRGVALRMLLANPKISNRMIQQKVHMTAESLRALRRELGI